MLAQDSQSRKNVIGLVVWGLFGELFGGASRRLGGGRKVYLGGLMVGGLRDFEWFRVV